MGEKMKKNFPHGFSLAEVLTAMGVFGIVGSLVAILFALSQSYYASGAAQADVQAETQQAITQMIREIRESSIGAYQINATKNAIIFVSARNSNGNFQVYTATGTPYWQKWICYYLVPQPGSSYSELIRKEGNPVGSTFPTQTLPAVPAGWETSFRNSNLTSKLATLDVQTLDIESNCGTATNALYLKLITTKVYAGKNTVYNSGIILGTGGCTSGIWIPVTLQN